MNVSSDMKVTENDSEQFSNCSQKKILYFSDGTLEVDEEDLDSPAVVTGPRTLAVNPQELTWFPWMWHQTVTAGSKALEVCDFVGESLASFFGITTPKYQFEINEYLRIKKAEEEDAQNGIEMGSWTNRSSNSTNSLRDIVDSKPKVFYSNNVNNLNIA
ncbi:hypothetical protein RUM44_011756 [Polyplax serrata]|uniref:Protein FAM177A1 n=1 Tax=Polyplax serrata TaxID=468196 RepID=A0ABR1AQZ1_POLSC